MSTRKDPLEPYREQILWTGSHEVARRSKIIFDVFAKLGDESGFRFLGEQWQMLETSACLAGWIEHAVARRQLSAARRVFMDSDERAAYAALPPRITVWRGCGSVQSAIGLSWTTDRAVAERFAEYAVGGRRRYFGMVGTAPLLATANVRKSDVFAVKLGRDEHEVIVLPNRCPIVPTVKKLKARAKK